MLSPRAEEDIMPAQNRAERGNRTTEEQESSISRLFFLLTRMSEEMKKRDEQFREELRWRDETLDTKNKRREENLASILQ